ncbi:MAG TPA: LysM domain-containing protein [Steroidobacteraceae bacterium]|nr:LysM domain-containing protein [Steroidobacteraceae bacterium]
MVSNQVLARLIAGLLTLPFALAGCAHLHHRGESTAAAVAPPPSASAAAQAATPAPAQEETATEAAISAAGAQASAPAAAPAASVVNPTAPKHYVVKRGDTLWGIASMFLKDPWLWPEVWIINPQVPNPHLIYPGDTLALAYGADGRPQVVLEQAGAARLDPRLRSTALDTSIPTIPYASIQGFLSHPTLLASEQIKAAPYVLAFRDMHQVAGSGNEVYVSNLTAQQNARYAVVHVGDELRDPDDNALLGYEGIYTATAIVERPGNPSKAVLIDPARETVAGDRLLTSDEEATPVNFTLRAPAGDIHGRIIAIVGGTDLVGQFEVVAINRGKRHGLEAGNVLAVDSAGEVVSDMAGRTGGMIGSRSAFARTVQLPDERSGTLLVFKVFDRMSYGLIVGASDTIHRLDVVRNP